MTATREHVEAEAARAGEISTWTCACGATGTAATERLARRNLQQHDRAEHSREVAE